MILYAARRDVTMVHTRTKVRHYILDGQTCVLVCGATSTQHEFILMPGNRHATCLRCVAWAT